MTSVEIFGAIFVLLAIGGLTFVIKNYFGVNMVQLRKKESPIAYNQMNGLNESAKTKTYLSADDLHASGNTVTESNNNMSDKKFDGNNLNPEHDKPNIIDENSEENKATTEAAKKGVVYDIANESAMNQPQDRRVSQPSH